MSTNLQQLVPPYAAFTAHNLAVKRGGGSGSTESNRIFNGAQIFASFPAPPTPPFQLSVLAFLCLFPQCSNFHLPWSIKWAFCVCATDCLVSSFQPLPHANDRGPGGSSTNYHSYNPLPKSPDSSGRFRHTNKLSGSSSLAWFAVDGFYIIHHL